jgi:hypothetical protein
MIQLHLIKEHRIEVSLVKVNLIEYCELLLGQLDGSGGGALQTLDVERNLGHQRREVGEEQPEVVAVQKHVDGLESSLCTVSVSDVFYG